MMIDLRPKINDRRRCLTRVFLLLIFLSVGFGLQSGFSQEVTQQVEGFTLQGFNAQGDPAWDVTGDQADILGDTIKISNVDANAYGENDVNIKARHGEVNKASGDVFLKEDVVVTTDTGSQLRTDSLQWEKEKNIVSTQDPAVITDKTMKATGIGLRANSELKTAQLDREVTVEMDATGSDTDDKEAMEQIVITCDGPMELDYANNIAILKENVMAVRGEETLKADLVEVYFDPETKKIVTIVCTDNVSVQRGENISYSDKAIYNAADQKVIFVGRPKLIMKTDEQVDSFF